MVEALLKDRVSEHMLLLDCVDKSGENQAKGSVRLALAAALQETAVRG